MHPRLNPYAKAVGAIALVAIACATSLGAESSRNDASRSRLEPTAWQGPALTAQLVPPAAGGSATTPNVPVPNVPAPNVPAPSVSTPIGGSQSIVVPGSGAPMSTTAVPGAVNGPVPPANADTPLLDGKLPPEELMPPVVEAGNCDEGGHEGVQPYGGGHSTDWSWGCGGSPYRNGPGLCDNWKVGCRWHVTVDGIVMTRDDANLNALTDQIFTNNTFMSGDGTAAGGGTVGTPQSEQFGHGPGGRISFTSQLGRCTCYDVQAVYEGINDWNASVVFPKQALPAFALPIPPITNTVGGGVLTEPPAPFPEGFQQRSLHYRSSLNSGELNFIPNTDPVWRPFFGVRFIRFDDEISDVLNQERQIPLPGPRTDSISPGPVPPAAPILVNDPIGPTFETDRLNLFHIQNNLMGFQIGLLHDTVRLNDRVSIEGFVNAGVYYNRVKYSNVMGVYTTQTFADNTRTTTFDESRTDQSNIVNNDVRELSEISYESEASLTGVCRLNKCWALRAGYQVLWINHLHLADDAFLGDAEASQDLLFHGWHAGIECRR